jgi:hypothetical protein
MTRHIVTRPIGQRVWTVAFLAAFVAFWVLRAAYWSRVEEAPFSDMAGFDAVARGIATSFDFKWSEFWRSYTTPSLVAARALQITLFGDGLLAWRIFQSVLTCAGLAWLALELVRTTGSRGLALTLVVLVALSQPSVFWSFKLSREGFHEAATYFTAASVLFALRRPGWLAWGAVGVILAVNFLNRPNAILIVPVVALVVLVALRRPPAAETSATRARALGALTIGIAILWTPWIVRSVRIYGEPVPLSTQAPYTALWSLGEVRVRLDDGTEVVTHVNTLQADAERDFPHDLAASRYANRIAAAWMREHLTELPRIFTQRIRISVAEREEHLTRVPRDRLFGTSTDRLLIDKKKGWIYTGALGLLVLPVFYGWGFVVLAAAALLPWLSAAALVPYARMLDASIPLILFGNVAWVVLVWRGWVGRAARSARAPGGVAG